MTEDSLLGDSVARFVEREYGFEQRRRMRAMPTGSDPGIWRAFADMGWLGLPVPEAAGGYGGTPADFATLMHGFGRALVLEPWLPCALSAAGLLATLGSDAQRTRWLEPALAGRARIALAHLEPRGRFDPSDCASSARAEAGGWRLDGIKTMVAGGADTYLVLARSRGECGARTGLSLFVVDRDTPGLSLREHDTVDGLRAGTVELRGLLVPAEALLGPLDGALPALEACLDTAAAMACAEAIGVMEVLFEDTLQYCKERRQFGRALAENQALAHRLVDLHVALREAQAMGTVAIDALARDDMRERERGVSSAKVLIGQALRLIGQEAVQLHGAIAITDDLRVSHYFKRATVLAHQYGDTDWHLARLARLSASDDPARPIAMAGVALSPEEQAFAEDLRRFVREALPASVARKVALDQALGKDDHLAWEQALAARGWLTYAWAEPDGGAGWTPRQQFIFDAICYEMDCPIITPFGVRMVGPVLNRYGTAAQKAQHLPGIRNSTVWWCQGYSEPGSGSDLASLSTRAERRGDKYVLNGQKIWTSSAQHADWMFCLVRTSREAKSQRGISFLLVDMRTPGIELRPIIALDGVHGFNSVFFTDVEVPVANLVGEEGDGWRVAKYLLSHERLEVSSLGPCQRAMRRLRESALQARADGTRLIDEPAFGLKLAQAQVRLVALERRVLGYLEQQQGGAALGPEVSQLKIRGTELYQWLLELIMDAAGGEAWAYDGEFVRGRSDSPAVGDAMIGAAASRYFNRRCMSILGGSNEIQKNILAKAVLGI